MVSPFNLLPHTAKMFFVKYLPCLRKMNTRFAYLDTSAMNDEKVLSAISSSDVETLRTLLEAQDEQLWSQVAQTGSVEIATYLLSRHPVRDEDDSQYISQPNPTRNPKHYLVRQSARYGNVAVFRHLLKRAPSLFAFNRSNQLNNERVLVNAIEGGVPIWEVILESDPRWKDAEFHGHHGCVLEQVLRYGTKELLEYLLKAGADAERTGAPVLDCAKAMKMSPDILEVLERYS